MDSIYKIDTEQLMGSKEYLFLANDIFKFVSIQFSIQFMYFLANPQKNQMFDADFLMLILFLIIGLLFYWLIFRKIVSFE